jgi:predicted Rossmann-fold nucleotide-binding protein
LLNVKGFYDGLLAQMEHMAREGFLHDDTRVMAATDAEVLLDALLANIVRVA